MFSQISDSVLGFLTSVLAFLHDLVEPAFGANSWGWAIILLTLIVRVALLPLAIKQTRSMRAMQALQPQMKELQKKYKVDRELMRKDPEQYRAKKQKLNEEMMALYQREGANPAASCLPLLAQAPIFLALFWTLQRSGQEGGDLAGAPFYFFTEFVSADSAATGLAASVSAAGWPGWLLILLMSGTMFWSQRQMMARNAVQGGDNPMAQQQKILLYVMPVFLAVISFNFPLGILLYWVTTNFWQVGQQYIILREVKHEAETGELKNKPGGDVGKPPAKGGAGGSKGTGSASSGRRPSPGASSGKGGRKPSDADSPSDDEQRGSSAPDPGPNGDRPRGSGGAKGAGRSSGARRREHLPRRGGAS